jgi:hypothetical protein
MRTWRFRGADSIATVTDPAASARGKPVNAISSRNTTISEIMAEG